MTKQVTFKKESFNELKQNIRMSASEMITQLEKILNETNELDKIYNTKAGKLFKEKLIEYIKNRIKFINDNYLGLNDILNIISSEYENYFDDVKKNVGGN